jgi:hypothetical protein
MAERRQLSFSRLEEIMPDVDRLLAGYVPVGNWSLGQVCNHTSGTIRASIEGSEVNAPWLVRKTLGPVIRKRILSTGKIKEGIKTLESYVPKSGLDDRAEAEALRASIAYYLTHPEPRASHPFFGRMTAEEWDLLHRIHCAHHLSFVLPA